MKKETKAKARAKAEAEMEDSSKQMKLAEKYDFVSDIFNKKDAKEIIEKIKDFPFVSEVFIKKKGNPAPVVYAAADVVFTETGRVDVCKGKDYACVLNFEDDFKNFINENKRREEYVEEHEVKFVAEEGKMTYNDIECSQVAFVFKMRQLFPALL